VAEIRHLLEGRVGERHDHDVRVEAGKLPLRPLERIYREELELVIGQQGFVPDAAVEGEQEHARYAALREPNCAVSHQPVSISGAANPGDVTAPPVEEGGAYVEATIERNRRFFDGSRAPRGMTDFAIFEPSRWFGPREIRSRFAARAGRQADHG
jgi:hypothetical protein